MNQAIVEEQCSQFGLKGQLVLMRLKRNAQNMLLMSICGTQTFILCMAGKNLRFFKMFLGF